MSGFATPPAGQTPCRNCGYPLNAEASVCGNCGSTQSGKRIGSGPTFTPSPVSGKLIRRLVVLAIVAAFFAFVRGPIMDAVDGVRDAFEESEIPGIFSTAQDDGGGAPGIVPPIPEDPAPPKGFSGVRELVDALHRGGFKCDQTKVDSEGSSGSTGSCQGYGAHVQINVYLEQSSLDSVKNSFFTDDYAFSFVHKDNWFVITQHAVAKKVHKALGGKLFKGTSGL